MEAVADVDELFEREYTRLVRALGVAFDPEAAADAVQEAFVEADRRWRTVGGYVDPAAWVRRVAINRLRNGRRDQRRRTEILATLRPVADDDLTAELIDLRRALAVLPQQQRICVCLHYLGALPVAEVSDALGIAEGTVKSHLHDARANLRAALAAPDDAEVCDG